MVAISSSSTDNQSESVSNRAVLDATAGAVAGCVQRFVVAPLDVIKIRFQVQVEPVARGAATVSALPSKYTSVLQAAITIVREEGIKVCLRRDGGRGSWVQNAYHTNPVVKNAYTQHNSTSIPRACGVVQFLVSC